MEKGVTCKHRKGRQQPDEDQEEEGDPLMSHKATKINFIQFLMYFYGIAQIDNLIRKPVFTSKQRKLSHLVCIFGHLYLLKDILRQIDLYHHNCLNKNIAAHGYGLDLATDADRPNAQGFQFLQTQYQFLNAVDRDFSTPIILALKNKRISIVKLLLEHPKTCLKQSSMKYGTPLHVAIANHEYKLAIKMLRMLKNGKDFSNLQDVNRTDEEGNTSLHLVMRFFNTDSESSSKIAKSLIRRGANLKALNNNQLTPLHVALYYAQNEAIKFALSHNRQLRRSSSRAALPMFDFREQEGKHKFSPLHYAVFQSNFALLMMILKSDEQLDHFQEDAEGRRAIDLCNSISSIFKALRHQLDIQRRQKVAAAMTRAREEAVQAKTGEARGGAPSHWQMLPL